MTKQLIWIMATAGGVVGGYLPTIFGISDFSGWGILWGTIGGVAGAIFGYQLRRFY